MGGFLLSKQTTNDIIFPNKKGENEKEYEENYYVPVGVYLCYRISP